MFPYLHSFPFDAPILTPSPIFPAKENSFLILFARNLTFLFPPRKYRVWVSGQRGGGRARKGNFRAARRGGMGSSFPWGGWGAYASLVSAGAGCARGPSRTRSCWRRVSSPRGRARGGVGRAGGGGARPFFWAAGSVEKRRGLGQPGCGEAAARGAGGAGGSGARSEDAARRQTNPRSHQPGVSALELDIHLTGVYPPPFLLKHS